MIVIQYTTPNRIDSPIVRKCIESVKMIYPQASLTIMPESARPIYDANVWRWQRMCESDDIMWIDDDIELFEPIPMQDNGLPSFLFYLGQPDFCLMHSPKKEIFQEYEKERKLRGLSYDTYAWHRKLLRDKPCNQILDSCVKHYRLSGRMESIKQHDLIYKRTKKEGG